MPTNPFYSTVSAATFFFFLIGTDLHLTAHQQHKVNLNLLNVHPFCIPHRPLNKLGFLEQFLIFPWLELNLELFKDKWVRVNMHFMFLNSMNKTDCVWQCVNPESVGRRKSFLFLTQTQNTIQINLNTLGGKNPTYYHSLKYCSPADQIFCSN